MYYILEDGVELRRWKDGRPCCVAPGVGRAMPLTDDEYALLVSCDGTTDLEGCRTLLVFEAMGVISRVERGARTLTPGQIREFANHRFHMLTWSITDRCNHRCLHCFHAADNDVRRDEFTREEAYSLIREAAECGIPNFLLTGGEPTTYPHFREVVRRIREQGLNLSELLTNASRLTEDLICDIRTLHPRVRFTISFDGLGHHDWLRQVPGSEKQTLSSIARCVRMGVPVKVNMNVNRRNRDVVFESACALADIGIHNLRIIKTTEAPRWALNAADDSLTSEEYYEFTEDFTRAYRLRQMELPVTIWQTLYLDGRRKSYRLLAQKSAASEHTDGALLCGAFSRKVSIQPSGDVVPCSPIAGVYASRQVSLGNVKRDGLAAVLTDGPLIDEMRLTTADVRAAGGKCATCDHFSVCQGGCPAISSLYGGSVLAPDVYKCAFFEGDYGARLADALDGWVDMGHR